MTIVADKISSPFRWSILPAYRKHLLGPHGLRLDEWLANGQVQIVKHGPHRTVYRVEVPELCFYLKHNRLPNRRAWLRGLVRPSKARMEHDRVLAIAARGVPTIKPIGLGEAPGWKPGESWLITEALEKVEPLSTFLEGTFTGLSSARQTRLRQRIAVCLATFIGRMHDAGVRHNDLHTGNILLRLDEQDQPRLFLVDLHAVKMGRPLGWRASRDNLVLLNQWFSMRTYRSDRLRFWRAYLKARRDSGLVRFFTRFDSSSLHSNQLARDLEQRTWAANLRFWRNRDRRCVVANRYYEKLSQTALPSSSRLNGMTVADLDCKALEALLENLSEAFHRPDIQLLKDSPSSTVVEMAMPVQGVSCPVIYKRFIGSRSWRDWLADKFRPLPALTSWINGHGLRERCLPSPRPLAIFRQWKCTTNLDSYLITAKVPNAIDLHVYLTELSRLPSAKSRAQIRQGIDQLARLVREMHRRQVTHRDLKAVNILVQRPKADFPIWNVDFGPFWLIDLVGARLPRSLSVGRMIQNLARLNASFPHPGILTRSDKVRFLRIYLQWGLFGRFGWKAWWAKVDKATQAKVIRNERNARPLT